MTGMNAQTTIITAGPGGAVIRHHHIIRVPDMMSAAGAQLPNQRPRGSRQHNRSAIRANHSEPRHGLPFRTAEVGLGIILDTR